MKTKEKTTVTVINYTDWDGVEKELMLPEGDTFIFDVPLTIELGETHIIKRVTVKVSSRLVSM